jgi:HrpA-like RNA helicase
VIISSATINTKKFSEFFDFCPIVSIASQVYPVQVMYKDMKGASDIDSQIDAILTIVRQRKKQGDILVFLPGEFDIMRTVNALYMDDAKGELIIYPLYARLSKEEQESVFTPTPRGKTKVVVSTNIAETSVTIDGIATVIDCGIAKMNFYNQRNFTSSLVALPISKSSAEQRKGRAGRTQPGVCYRLYNEKDFVSRFTYSTEEILRTDLSEVVLRMSDLGIYDYEHFPFITKPKTSAIQSAEETLRFIGAIDERRHLTNVGELMCRFPLLPRQSRVIVESMLHYPNVLQQVLIAVAFLSSKTPFLFPAGEEDLARAAQRTFADKTYGDFVTYLHVYEQYQKNETQEKRQKFCKTYYLDFQSMQEIVHVTEQLGDICGEIGFPLSHGGTPKEFLICIASGLLQYICVRSERNAYQSLTADQIFIHPGSDYFRTLPQFIIAGEIVQTSRMYARSVSPLQKEWMDEIKPGLYAQLTRSFTVRKNKEEGRRSDRAHAPVEGDFRDNKTNGQTIQVYHHSYPSEVFSGKKGKPCALIPYEDLAALKQENDRAPKRPRNFNATVLYAGYRIHQGDKFFSVIDLAGKLRTDTPVYDAPPTGSFTLADSSTLVGKLESLLCFVKSKKDRKSLGFISLDGNRDVFRFSFNRNFFDALDDTLFYLGQLVEELKREGKTDDEREAKRVYSRLLKLAD